MFNDALITTAPNGQLFVNSEQEINWKQAFPATYRGATTLRKYVTMQVRIVHISVEIRTGHPLTRTVSLPKARSFCVDTRGKYIEIVRPSCN